MWCKSGICAADSITTTADFHPGPKVYELMVGGRQNAVAGVVSTLLKYLIEGLAVAIVAYALPAKKLKLEEIAMIAVTAAATFAILDMYAPATSGAARMGAGFGVGGNLVGFA
jgi:hypothetical protein